MTQNQPVTVSEAIAGIEAPDEMDVAFAELVVLTQKDSTLEDLDYDPDDMPEEDFEPYLQETLLDILGEDHPNLKLEQVVFDGTGFSGIFASDGKRYHFELSQSDDQWSKTIRPL